MTIEKIRNNIHNNMGNVAVITHNEGRNRILEYEGKVIEVYRNIFVILDKGSKKSFSYHDVLTDTTRVSFKMSK
ncbi:MAG: hypothetical protein IJ509_01775 [Bacilli bacterium]|nr:hypothetical protein [Bacilli bacterium]